MPERKLRMQQLSHGFMTDQEWMQLADLLQKARTGDERAIGAVCEFIDSRMKLEITGWLWKAGVGNYVDEAYQDVLLTVRRKIPQLEVIDCWKIWLWRVAMSMGGKYRPRYVRYPRQKQPTQEVTGRPKLIGTHCVSINGQVYPVTVLEPYRPQEQKARRQRLFEPLSDSVITHWSRSNRPQYPVSIDVRQALEKLPERWALAIQLVYFEGYSRTEAANIMGCSRTRIFKLLQKAKSRLRGLLAGYAQNDEAKSESRSCNANRRARTKRALPVSDVLPRRYPIRVAAPVRAA